MLRSGCSHLVQYHNVLLGRIFSQSFMSHSNGSAIACQTVCTECRLLFSAVKHSEKGAPFQLQCCESRFVEIIFYSFFTGYVLISHVDVTRIVLPSLQIIRGRTLFKLSVHEDEFALMVTLSKMHNLELPALRGKNPAIFYCKQTADLRFFYRIFLQQTQQCIHKDKRQLYKFYVSFAKRILVGPFFS